jgi:hypothetical protein
MGDAPLCGQKGTGLIFSNKCACARDVACAAVHDAVYDAVQAAVYDAVHGAAVHDAVH